MLMIVERTLRGLVHPEEIKEMHRKLASGLRLETNT